MPTEIDSQEELASTKFLPFHVPSIGEEEIQAVTEVLRSGWITTGPRVKEFESAFSRYTGARDAVAVNSGTAALHLSLAAIDLRAGDEVVIPTMTFAATGEVVLYCGARPVLVDCERGSFNLSVEALERAITPRTRAVIPVHYGGHPCDMEQILKVAERHGLKVIEDAAHALPGRYKGRMVGTLGDITCFSFYATKTITTGEGGMATSENEEYAERMRILSLHGISKDAWKRYARDGEWRYEVLEAGYKYNLTDLQAALGIVQLSKCDAMWRRRQSLAQRYTNSLNRLDAYEVPVVSADVQHAWHLFVVLVDPSVLSIHRDRVIKELTLRGIGTSVHFIPLHLHPLYQRRLGYRAGQFPVAEGFFDRCISLPLSPAMTDDDADRVLEALADIAQQFRR
jgi:dTDP-4-amino-4,6-dideoxygalactose transaminase